MEKNKSILILCINLLFIIIFFIVGKIFAAEEVTGKVRLSIMSPIGVEITWPGDGVVFLGQQEVAISTGSFDDQRYLKITNKSKVSVDYQIKTGTALTNDQNQNEVMTPGESAGPDTFVIYTIFYELNTSPELNDYASNDRITTTYTTASNTQFAKDGYANNNNVGGYSVASNAVRYMKFRLDTPTLLTNTSYYDKEVDIPIYIKAVQAQ